MELALAIGLANRQGVPRPVVLTEDFNYADTAALLAVWTAGGTTPLVTLAETPKRIRVENGAAAIAFASRQIPVLPGPNRVIGNLFAKGANMPRCYIGTAPNTLNLGSALNLAVGQFVIDFIAPTPAAPVYLTFNTNSTTLGHFLECNSLVIF